MNDNLHLQHDLRNTDFLIDFGYIAILFFTYERIINRLASITIHPTHNSSNDCFYLYI